MLPANVKTPQIPKRPTQNLSNAMKFKTSLDYLARIVTIGVTILSAAIIIAQILILKDNYSSISIFTIAALLLLYFGTYAYRPVSYILTDNEVNLHRPLFDKKIARSEIKSVE